MWPTLRARRCGNSARVASAEAINASSDSGGLPNRVRPLIVTMRILSKASQLLHDSVVI